MKTRLLMLTAIFNALFGTAIAGQGEKVSYDAPAVSGVNQDGATVNFADVYKKGPTVVFFYPKADTPGCTKQACGFRDDMTGLKDKGIEVVGVSGDSVRNHQLFKKVHDLNFTLLADEDGSVAKAFDVPLRAGGEITRQIDGEDFVLKRGVTAERWTIIVDKEGKVARRYKVKDAAGDSQNILKAIAELQ